MISTNKWPYVTKQCLLRAETYYLLGVRNEIADIEKTIGRQLKYKIQ